MSKKKAVSGVINKLKPLVVEKEVPTNKFTFDVDTLLMVYLSPKLKSDLLEAIKSNPQKAERLIKIANMVCPEQLQYTIDKNLY